MAGLHIDAINGRADVQPLLNLLPSHTVLSLGVINGRNVWKTDLTAVLDWIEADRQAPGRAPVIARRAHCFTSRWTWRGEQSSTPRSESWLAFALQKLDELNVLATALNQGRDAVRPSWRRTRRPSPPAALRRA